MATVLLHPAFNSISGKNGGLVFRRMPGKTVIARTPDVREKDPSPAQRAQRDRFTQAAEYARGVLSDPWQRRVYDRLASTRNRRVDKLLMSDYLTPPVVEEIDLSDYQRRAGDLVRVIASDDLEVASVDVAIHTARGERIEQGPAVQMHGVWCYRTTTVAAVGEALVISAVARDRPGNEGRQTVVCP